MIVSSKRQPKGVNSMNNIVVNNNSNEDTWLFRGDIVWAKMPTVKGQFSIKPVVVIQNNIGNRYSPKVIVAGVSSSESKLERFKKDPISTQMLIDLDRKSLVMAEDVHTISKRDIVRKSRKMTKDEIKELNKILQVSLGFDEELY